MICMQMYHSQQRSLLVATLVVTRLSPACCMRSKYATTQRSMCHVEDGCGPTSQRQSVVIGTLRAGSVCAQVKKLQEQVLKPREQVTLEPYERDHAMVVGVYRPPPKKKA